MLLSFVAMHSESRDNKKQLHTNLGFSLLAWGMNQQKKVRL
jgi:hypothetical protein